MYIFKQDNRENIFFTAGKQISGLRIYFASNLLLLTNNMMHSKLYIPSTLNIDLILWHSQLIVYAVKG